MGQFLPQSIDTEEVVKGRLLKVRVKLGDEGQELCETWRMVKYLELMVCWVNFIRPCGTGALTCLPS